MIPLLMWFLASLDAAFVGFRDAAGRNPILEKRAFYWHNTLRGLWVGQLVVVAVAAAIAGAHFLGGAPDLVWQLHLQAGRDMLWIYAPYAALAISALLVYAIPDEDISSLATVIVLGPFTTLRPLVILAGGAFTLAHRGLNAAAPSVLVACLLMLSLHALMSLRWRGYDPVEG